MDCITMDQAVSNAIMNLKELQYPLLTSLLRWMFNEVEAGNYEKAERICRVVYHKRKLIVKQTT